MGKGKRKVKKSPLSIIIYLLIIVVCGYLSFNNYNQIKKYEKNIIKEKNKYKEVNKSYNDLLKSNKEVASELDKMKNIDKSIEESKKEVFDLAKKAEENIKNGKTNYKIAYLTFDDGPYYLTYDVLNILKEKQVKATFFTIGAGKESCIDNRGVDCTEIYKQIVDKGHTIANHTYSHAIFAGLYSSVDTFINDVEKQESLINSKTGIKTDIVRFPGGSSTAKGLKNGIIEKLKEKGYGWVDWTAQDGDGGGLASNEQAWNILTNSLNDNIEVVLFHDYNRITYSILPDAIKYMEDNNYILLPLFHDSVMVNK